MSELILPNGYEAAVTGDNRGMVVNETDLPDHVVTEAVGTFFEEHASMLGVGGATSFQSYANNGGSLLTRSRFRVPSNVLEEVILARDLAERDDDVGSVIGALLALAFGDGMRNQHADEITVALFDEIARLSDLDMAFQEMYREYLIAGQFTTATLFSQEEVSYLPASGDRTRNRTISSPNIGVIPAEQVVVLDNDMFRTAALWYRPANSAQETWLREFFAERTTAARKSEMRRQDPVLTFLLTEMRRVDPTTVNAIYMSEVYNPASGEWVFRLNPTSVARTTLPKGSWPHPRPLMTRNFPLLEAKRLLNLMDYALLEGGSNFLVVAKKGSDLRPALPVEIENLQGTIRRAARSGVLVGDHRLSIEIITPDMTELLNPEKRKMLGAKLAKALLRLPDFEEGTGNQAAANSIEIMSRVIQSDRRAVKRHVENRIYSECAKRIEPINSPATLWFPRIILQGTNFFTDMVLKLRDRGDISRRSAIETAGFSYDFELSQRKIEKSRGDDRVMTPAEVPFSGGAGPQDNGAGRPRGTSSGNGAPGGKSSGGDGKQRKIARNAGETVTAMQLEDGVWTRAGEFTADLLEEFADTSEIGRLTQREREALTRISDDGMTQSFQHGALTVIPVNAAYEVGDVRAVRLAPGLTALVGNRIGDDAVVARALSFRTPEFTDLEAEERASAFGFVPPDPEPVAIGAAE